MAIGWSLRVKEQNVAAEFIHKASQAPSAYKKKGTYPEDLYAFLDVLDVFQVFVSLSVEASIFCRWCMKEGVLTVEWDTESNIRAIKERVDLLTKGCKCTTGCSTNRCGCRKRGNECSLGCECTNCINTEKVASVSAVSEEMREIAIEEEHATLPVDEIMDFVLERLKMKHLCLREN